MLEALGSTGPFWILCLAFVIAFLLAFSVGANDVSNSFGTSVGARVLTVTQACILATFFEVAGSTLLGYSVCDTFRRKMYDASLYEDSQKELMLGALACLMGSAFWNIVATALKMPISGTHSIVGATIGFSIVLRGWGSIKWRDMIRIVVSWFASPLLSGIISSLIYIIISKTVICKVDPLRHGLKALPLFYGITIFINVASVVIDGPDVLGLSSLPWYAGLFVSLVFAALTTCIVAMILVPRLRREILDEIVQRKTNTSNKRGFSPEKLKTVAFKRTTTGHDNVAFKPDSDFRQSPAKPKRELTLDANQLMEKSSGASQRPPIAPKPHHLKRQAAQEKPMEEIDLSVDRPSQLGKLDLEAGSGGGDKGSNAKLEMFSGEPYEVSRLFSTLQILTACFASFAHGTNDVSNAVAPLVPIWNIYATGQEDITKQTQVWILAFGGIGICTGLWAWGRAVMSTVGDGLTKLTPSKGFAIELGAAVSVLTATKLGLPISTTHCKIGSVVIVGLISSTFLSQDNLLYQNEMERQQRESGDQKAAPVRPPAVDWKLFGNIAITWIVTVPLAASASALIMVVLKWLAL